MIAFALYALTLGYGSSHFSFVFWSGRSLIRYRYFLCLYSLVPFSPCFLVLFALQIYIKRGVFFGGGGVTTYYGRGYWN